MDIYIQKKKGSWRSKWAVRQKGKKRALRLFPDLESAFKYAMTVQTPVVMHQWVIEVLNAEEELIQQKIKFKSPTG